MTREEAKDQIIDNLYIPSKKFAESYNIVKYTVDFIFDKHEAQIKAKDEEIEKMKSALSKTISKDIVGGFKLGDLKARSIVAMLFWEWRKDKRIYENANKYTKETAELYVNCSELSFKKAYAMLKGKQMSEDMKWRIELTKNMGMAFGMGVVVFDICERFSPYIFINLGKYALSIGRFQ